MHDHLLPLITKGNGWNRLIHLPLQVFRCGHLLLSITRGDQFTSMSRRVQPAFSPALRHYQHASAAKPMEKFSSHGEMWFVSCWGCRQILPRWWKCFHLMGKCDQLGIEGEVDCCSGDENVFIWLGNVIYVVLMVKWVVKQVMQMFSSDTVTGKCDLCGVDGEISRYSGDENVFIWHSDREAWFISCWVENECGIRTANTFLILKQLT